MRIALDAMGGDHAPREIVRGALEAIERFGDVEVLLAGRPEAVGEFLPKPAPARIEIVACAEVVEMAESPVEAIRRKKDSSLRRIFELTAAGKADAAISAGNTGATVAAASMLLKPLPGCRRPGIAASFPSTKGHTVVIDVGANITPKPLHLLQYGIMAQVFAREVLGVSDPKVGILNVGTEEEKGTDFVKESRTLLAASLPCFVGSVEGRDIFNGSVDVIVCDGFVGNALLKCTEGCATYVVSHLLSHMKEILPAEGPAVAAQLRAFIARTDYTEYGGAPLLGVEKVAIISHGSSNSKAIASAIRVARDFGARDVNAKISGALAAVETSAAKENGQ